MVQKVHLWVVAGMGESKRALYPALGRRHVTDKDREWHLDRLIIAQWHRNADVFPAACDREVVLTIPSVVHRDGRIWNRQACVHKDHRDERSWVGLQNVLGGRE